jgi:hypothetical protein
MNYRVKRNFSLPPIPYVVIENHYNDLLPRSCHCYWCDQELTELSVSLDHYVPLKRGGEHKPSNMVFACKRCNRFRSAMLPEEYEHLIHYLKRAGMLEFFFRLFVPAPRSIETFERLSLLYRESEDK